MTLNLGGNVTMKLVLIPAGEFLMGSPKTEAGRENDEGPQRKVTISKPFYMGIYEVTRSQWREVMTTELWAISRNSRSKLDYAASMINWKDAGKFCLMLSKRIGKKVSLPTEAQWEYACRAGRTTAYSFGDDQSELGDYAWYQGNIRKRTNVHEVGRKRPNPWGLYDLHGNVSEWCRDGYDEKFYAVSAKKGDPENTKSSGKRVLRGGSFNSFEKHCRSAARDTDHSTNRAGSSGFRVLVSAEGAN